VERTRQRLMKSNLTCIEKENREKIHEKWINIKNERKCKEKISFQMRKSLNHFQSAYDNSLMITTFNELHIFYSFFKEISAINLAFIICERLR
jgi:hypothetical protein